MNVEITQEMVDTIIREEVLKTIDDGIEIRVYESFRHELSKKIDSAVQVIADEKGVEILKQYIEQLSDEKIVVDDGWNKRETFDSLFDLYKSELKKTLTEYSLTSNLKKIISGIVERDVNNSLKEVQNEVVNKYLAKKTADK